MNKEHTITVTPTFGFERIKGVDDIKVTVASDASLMAALREANVSVDGYTLEGFYYTDRNAVLDSDFASADITVYAEMSKAHVITVTPTFGFEPIAEDVKVNVAADANLKDALDAAKISVNGYVLEGYYYTDRNAVLDSDFASADITVYAEMSKAHTITVVPTFGFDRIKGAEDVKVSVAADANLKDALDAAKISVDGYTLEGFYYTDRNAVLDSDFVSADITVYAEMSKAHTITVTPTFGFDRIKGAEDVKVSVAADANLKDALDAANISVEGYILEGFYYTDRNAVLDSDFVSADITVYAEMSKAHVITVTPTFGFEPIAEDVKVNVAPDANLKDALDAAEISVDGYMLEGYYYADRNAVLDSDFASADITVYAEMNKAHTITMIPTMNYAPIEGVEQMTVQAVSDSNLKSALDAAKVMDKLGNGYKFVGYYYADKNAVLDTDFVSSDITVLVEVAKVSSSSGSDNNNNTTTVSSNNNKSNNTQVVKAEAPADNTAKIMPQTGLTAETPVVFGVMMVAALAGAGAYLFAIRKKLN